jgi:hypothetical protein
MSKYEALGSTNINLWAKGRGVSQETRVTPLTKMHDPKNTKQCNAFGWLMVIIKIYHPRLNESRISFPFNPLNPELNPICCLLALLGANHFLYVSRIKVKSLTLRVLMSYICRQKISVGLMNCLGSRRSNMESSCIQTLKRIHVLKSACVVFFKDSSPRCSGSVL